MRAAAPRPAATERPWPERAGGGVEEVDADLRVGVAVDGGVDRAKAHGVLPGHRPWLFAACAVPITPPRSAQAA